jgi:hypothetical protein
MILVCLPDLSRVREAVHVDFVVKRTTSSVLTFRYPGMLG